LLAYRIIASALAVNRLRQHRWSRRNDPELGKMCADRIDHCRLLADKQMARINRYPWLCAPGRPSFPNLWIVERHF
jgi:hypothetical protein